MIFEVHEVDVKKYVKERFNLTYPYISDEKFDGYWDEYKNLKSFAPDGNIWESDQLISDGAHLVGRLVTQFYYIKVFQAQLIDLDNENVKEDLETGNIGTPGRLAKIAFGSNLNDNTESLSGRWIKPPRMASFKGEENPNQTPIWVTTQIRARCSHHGIEFVDNPHNPESFAVVGYIPENGVKGGISKISRFVRDFASRRMWLQEDLTEYIGKTIQQQFKTQSVFVGLFAINHGCSWTRGANDEAANTTTTFVSGKFAENPDLIPTKYRM